MSIAVVTLRDIEGVEAAFLSEGIDPKAIAEEFILYWLVAGKTAKEIVRIATNTKLFRDS